MDKEPAKRLTLSMAVLCVRNTCIEDIYAGIEPNSQAGDFSDARVVTPYGEIPWNKLSRIRNDEMREFMKQVVDRIYTVLLRLDEPGFVERMKRGRVVANPSRPCAGVDGMTVDQLADAGHLGAIAERDLRGRSPRGNFSRLSCTVAGSTLRILDGYELRSKWPKS